MSHETQPKHGFYFTYSARIYYTERLATKKAVRYFVHAGCIIAEFEKVNNYWCTKTNRPKAENTDSMHEYWIDVTGTGCFIRLGARDDQKACTDWLDAMLTRGLLNETLQSARYKITNPEKYEETQRELLDEKRKHAAELDEERKINLMRLKAEKEEAEKQALAQAENLFRRGERIAWPLFEKLCIQNNIKINIRTLGSARKNVHLIGAESYNVRNGSRPYLVMTYAKQLHAILSA